MPFYKSYESIINWIHQKLSAKQFLIFSSMLVGLTAGIAAVVLKTLVHYIHLAITRDHSISLQYYFYLAFPLIGILLTVFYVQKYRKGKLGRGTSNVLHAIAKKSSFLPKDQMYSHIITSSLTVGFGGSAGLESPIITTGSAIGSNYSKTYHVNYKDRTLLLASGAAAGIAAAFNAPIAGVLFALEVLLVNAGISAFIPLLIAAAVGALCSKIILKEGILLSFHLQQSFDYHNVPFYILLGVLAGFVSLYYSRISLKIESLFKPQKKQKVYLKALIGGSVLALLILLFPPLFGEGYESVKMLSDLKPEKLLEKGFFSGYMDNEWVVLFFVGGIVLLKAIATSITISSGGNGGNFAPSLFVGAYLGFFFSRLLNMLGIALMPESNFTIVGMAGILSGVFYAPLTAIFLIAEITGGYELMIPLMIVSAVSYTVVKYFEPYSMDTKRLAKKGHIFTQNKDKNILNALKMEKIIETDFQKISPEATLRQFVDVIAHSKRNIFPVVTENDQLAGVILLENVREIMFKTELYDQVLVKELMRKPPGEVNSDEAMYSVMKKFDETGAWNLPVLDNGKYVGFVSKSSIFTNYRKMLIKSSLD